MFDTTANLVDAIGAIRRSYTGMNDLGDLSPSDFATIDHAIESGLLGLRKNWQGLTIPDASELDADDWEIVRTITNHVVDWYFEHHMAKVYEAVYTVTYTREVTVSFKCKPDVADDVSTTIKDQLAERASDDSIDDGDFILDNAEIVHVSADVTEHFDTDIEHCHEQ